jgi:hypothetical protein
MGAAVERLTKLVASKTCYDIPWRTLLPQQIEAADELLQERLGQIKLLAHRADETGVHAIRGQDDIVPLLFAHTSYKSYPEAWFTEGKWDRMGQWLDTLTTTRVPRLDTRDVQGVDAWVDRMETVGFYLSCSSGTTGKCSILPAAERDFDLIRPQFVQALSWATGIEPVPQFDAFALTPLPSNARTVQSTGALVDAFFTAYRKFPGEPITPGAVSRMVALRRSVADGTALPAQIAAFEELAKTREATMQEGLRSTAEAVVTARGGPIFLQGMPVTMWQISQLVREMGYGREDFHPANALLMAGGSKGAVMPPDAKQRVFETFNVSPRRAYQFYSMQEINTVMPRCAAGRYHVAPWMMLLVLNESGDALIEPPEGEFEGRAAFMDLSLHGRWAGIITGDKISADFRRCACGHEGPTVGDQIVRYAELPGGDKISCAGTIDAYVRGAV